MDMVKIRKMRLSSNPFESFFKSFQMQKITELNIFFSQHHYVFVFIDKESGAVFLKMADFLCK